MGKVCVVFVGGLDWISDLIAGREDSFPRMSTGHQARTDFIWSYGQLHVQQLMLLYL